MSNLSQEEIDALMKGAGSGAGLTNESEAGGGDDTGLQEEDEFDNNIESLKEDISAYFDLSEIDALGEIGNICMGTSATTMYSLLGRRVVITTPSVSLFKPENILANYKCPFLVISVEFTEGLFGKNLLILKDYDAALITDLLMGGDGKIDRDNIVLNEIHLSAMSEVMNQMMGSAATAMANMMGGSVNISPPDVDRVEGNENIGKYLSGDGPVVRISFDMEIEGLLKSKLLQVMTVDVAKELINSLMRGDEAQPDPQPEAHQAATRLPEKEADVSVSAATSEKKQVQSVKPAVYQSFDEPAEVQQEPQTNFSLINDIPLQVTVELGKVKKNLNDVVNFGIGSLIVLDKQAGELVDVIVNGKRIAKGEVVVIEENYGVRITEILKT